MHWHLRTGLLHNRCVSRFQSILQAGAAELGTDESVFNQILCTRNYNQLRGTFRRYEDDNGAHLLDDIKSECTGTLELAYTTLGNWASNRMAFLLTGTSPKANIVTLDSSFWHVCQQFRVLFSVKFILDEELFYAERVQDALSGLGTDEQQLIRVVVGRCEVRFRTFHSINFLWFFSSGVSLVICGFTQCACISCAHSMTGAVLR